jgi:hypothetical protein
MIWWRDNFWIILAGAMVVVSSVLGLILYCVCRWQLRQGNGHLTRVGGGRGSVRTKRLLLGLYGLNFGSSIMHSGFEH